MTSREGLVGIYSTNRGNDWFIDEILPRLRGSAAPWLRGSAAPRLRGSAETASRDHWELGGLVGVELLAIGRKGLGPSGWRVLPDLLPAVRGPVEDPTVVPIVSAPRPELQ
jgi:hypothetical protein